MTGRVEEAQLYWNGTRYEYNVYGRKPDRVSRAMTADTDNTTTVTAVL